MNANQTSELDRATYHVRACRAKQVDIQNRIGSQRRVVADRSNDLSKLVDECAWEYAPTPAAASDARQACADAANHFKEEHQLLMALETAAANAKAESDRAKRKVLGVIGSLAASQIEGDSDKWIAA